MFITAAIVVAAAAYCLYISFFFFFISFTSSNIHFIKHKSRIVVSIAMQAAISYTFAVHPNVKLGFLDISSQAERTDWACRNHIMYIVQHTEHNMSVARECTQRV